MPFTVSCAACDSRFLLGDDLFRRKVSGKVVTVKCRKCNAEISVDATEPATLPSQEAPRRARPSPPRPKQSATGTPLPATGTPLPITATPLPRPTSATATPLPGDVLLSIWDAAENSDAPRKAPPPRPHAAARAQANDPEFIDDIEEAPASSSDAPSLNTLTHETHPKNPIAPKKKAPDDFLMNLSAGTGGILGAPTIDPLVAASPTAPDVEDLLEVEATELTPRAGTVPLFDMSAVLPVATGAVKTSNSSLSPANLDLSIDVDMPPTQGKSGKLRDRKYVVAPKTAANAPAPKRRAGAVVWFALVAAAASVLLVVGLRDHASSRHSEPEPEPEAAEHPTPSADPSPTSAVTASAPAAVTAEATPAPIAVDTVSTDKPSSAPNPGAVTAASVKSNDAPKAVAPEQQKAEAAPAVEKPAEEEKPTAPQIEPQPEPAGPGVEFDRAAALAALRATAAEAAACRKDGDPSGTASLTITFAPSGRVTSANIQGPPFAGTPTGGCIANAMRRAHVPAFSGDRVTVNKKIVIE